MQHPDQDPLILIHGEAQTGKQSLFEGLAGNLGGVASTPTLSIDTKYYTAKARVHLSGGSHQLRSLDQEVEAALIVFDSSRESTFESLKAWAATDESVGCAEIKLCIANRADALREGGAVKRSKWLEDAYEWCTDNMFEYIEVAPRNADADACLEFEGEKQGLQRVISALEAHMWPGLTMKDTSVSRPNFGGAQEGRDVDAQSAEGVADVSTPSYTAELEQAHEASSAREPASSLGNGHTTSGTREDGVGNDNLERESDSFEALMGDMLGARSRLQGLPDEQRRAAAESLTMQMMAKFGLDEHDSESE